MENQDKKRELIIEAALKRFAHFGLAKTTMTEIASDLSLSKALLYYYFPDKINLYAAVLESLIEAGDANVKEGLAKIDDSKDALYYYLNTRHEYLKKYYNIFEFIRSSAPELPQQLCTVLDKAKKIEMEHISLCIQKQPNISISPQEAASLLFDAFLGMRIPVFHSKKTFLLDSEEFEALLDRQKQLGTIFLKGL